MQLSPCPLTPELWFSLIVITRWQCFRHFVASHGTTSCSGMPSTYSWAMTCSYACCMSLGTLTSLPISSLALTSPTPSMLHRDLKSYHLNPLPCGWGRPCKDHATPSLQATETDSLEPRCFTLFKKGDQVWLDGQNLKIGYLFQKLAPKWEGPFMITEVLGPVTYHLKLPNQWWIRDVFHASLLSPYCETKTHGPNFMKPPLTLLKVKKNTR